MPNITYEVTGLTCGGCVNRVQTTLSSLADSATVTLTPPRATITNPKGNIDVLNQALSQAGNYQLKPLEIESSATAVETQQHWLSIYYPLFLIIAFITMIVTLIQFNQPSAFNWQVWMRHFMAGFFIVFSFFKLLDVKSFANSYAMYDLLAMRIKLYGLLYPFIELGLGIAYLTNWQPMLTNSITLVVMLFSSIGVIKSVVDKQKIRCACLGSVFNLPMSTVTIIEDLSMALMALFMLLA